MTSYSFPLALADFLDLLPISSITLDAPEQVEVSGTGGGEILTSELGPRLWQGEITLGKMTHDEAVQAEALIDLVRGPGRSFMITRLVNAWPQYDPDGAILGASTPVIDSLNADNARLTISGLPASYKLQRGDLLAFAYGSSPTRYALHRVANKSRVADGSGLTGWVELLPNIRSGASTGAAITLGRAACKAVLVPGSSVAGNSRRTITEGTRFKFIQTLR